MKLSLDMRIPNSTGGWTLAEAVEQLKSLKLTRILTNDIEELSELYSEFERAVRRGHTPTTGEVWAAYYLAASEALDEEYYAEESAMTARAYGGRKAAISRLVFRKVY